MTLLLARWLAGLALMAGVGLAVWDFPVHRLELAAGLAVYLAVLARWPGAWLIVLPALLPVLDLTPVSGRVYLDAFDFFVLTTLAAGLWRKGDGDEDTRTLTTAGWLVVLLFAATHAWTTARGVLPLGTIDANAFHSYLSPYNGLRVAKGVFWALLLLPMVGQARARARARAASVGQAEPQIPDISVGQALGLGMCLGLAGAVASVVWERALFPGLFDFDENYRVAGFFSGMHNGAPGIDAYLAAALPFAIGCFTLWRGHRYRHRRERGYGRRHGLGRRRAWRLSDALGFAFAESRSIAGIAGTAATFRFAGALLLAGGLYAVMVTFTRASYLALAASLGAMAFARGLGHATHLSGRRLLVRASLALLATALVAWPVLTGEFARSRLGAIGEDLRSRWAGLSQVLDLMTVDPSARWLGMGKGTFPRLGYLLAADEGRISTYNHVREDGNGFVRYSASDPSGGTRIRQRFAVDEPGPYRLDLELRTVGERPEYLLVEFCEQQIIQPSRECRWIGFSVTPKDGAWTDHHRPFSVDGLGKQHWYGARPVEVALLNRGLKDGLDMDNIQIVTPSGRRLLANGDFEAGPDHWFSEWKQHGAFHIHNLFLEAYFEGGVLGLLSLVVLLGYAAVRLVRRALAGDPMAVILMGSLTGLLVIGLFHSLMDDPRVFFLLVFSALFALIPAEPDSAQLAPTKPRQDDPATRQPGLGRLGPDRASQLPGH